VTSGTPDLPLAVLDTSFWTNGCQAEVVANCLDFFRIVVPRAVEAEIRAVQADAPRREYPLPRSFVVCVASYSIRRLMRPRRLHGLARARPRRFLLHCTSGQCS
jgi:hypothetical protein